MSNQKPLFQTIIESAKDMGLDLKLHGFLKSHCYCFRIIKNKKNSRKNVYVVQRVYCKKNKKIYRDIFVGLSEKKLVDILLYLCGSPSGDSIKFDFKCL